MFWKGYKNGLNVEDLWQARRGDNSGRLGDRLETAWYKELQEAHRKGHKPSLSKAIIRCFWLEYMIVGFAVGLLYIILW